MMNKLSNKITNKLKNVKPKSKWVFVVKNVLKDILIAVLWFLFIIGFGIVIYTISHYSPWRVLPSSFKFFGMAFLALPLELIGILILFGILMYYLSKKVHLIYRLNNWFLILIIILSLASGYLIAEYSGLNNQISKISSINKIYQKKGMLLKRNQELFTEGKIIEINKRNIIVEDVEENIWQINIDNNTKIRNGNDFVIGERVLVIGQKHENSIDALGIKKIDNTKGLRNRGSFIQSPFKPMY